MIKLFEEYNDIHSICEKYNISNYTINVDGSINVDGDVDLTNRKLTKLPLKFGRVTGDFFCSSNYLTSLEGSPSYVYYFGCHQNNLTSLEGGPEIIGSSFNCNDNQLISLKGSPKEVGGYFSCSYNQLTSLEGCPIQIGDDFDFSNNKLTTLKGGPKQLGGNFYCHDNNLPDLISFNTYTTNKLILKYQDDYSIWNADGTLNEYRFNDMMEEIKGLRND